MNHQYAMKRRQKHADGDDIIIIAWLLLLLLDDENIKFTLGSPLLHCFFNASFVVVCDLVQCWIFSSHFILFYFSSYVCRAFFHEVHRHQYSSAAAVVVVVGFDLEASWPAFCVC